MSHPHDVAVLLMGGPRIFVDGVEKPLPNLRAGAVLAELAAVGSPVATTRLIDLLWPDDPPQTALNQVQRLVGQLRRVFEPELRRREPGRYILGMGAGYRLSSTVWVDIAAVRTAAGIDDLLSALELAAPPPASLLDAEVRTRSAAFGLIADRSRLIARAAHAVIAADRVVEAYPLFTAVADLPLGDEDVQAAIIDVAISAGHHSDALERLEAVERYFRDELGAPPGEQLKNLRARLAEESALIASPPNPMADYVARAAVASTRARLFDWAQDDQTHVLVVSGLAGIGKTTLANQWASELAPMMPGGVVSIDLRGFDAVESPLSPSEVLSRLGAALGLTADAGTEAPGSALTRRLRFRRTLIVLDNAAEASQTLPVLDLAAHSIIVITSRQRLTSLLVRRGVVGLALQRWSPADSAEMFRARLAARENIPEHAFDALSVASAGLPLAIAVIAGRLVMSPTLEVGDVLSDLRSSRRLDALSTGDPLADVESSMLLSIERLSRPAERLLGLLTIHPNAPIGRHSAAAIDGTDDRSTRRAIDELLQANLLIEHASGSVVMHDLVRDVARTIEPERERREAELRLLDLYTQLVRDANNVTAPSWESVVSSVVIPGRFFIDNPVDAIEFLRSQDSLVKALRIRAMAIGAYAQALALTGYANEAMYYVRAREETIDACRDGIQAAEAIGDRANAARLRWNVANLTYEIRRNVDNIVPLATIFADFSAAEQEFVSIGHWRHAAAVVRTRCHMEADRGLEDTADEWFAKAESIAARHDIGIGLVFLLVARASLHTTLNRWDTAIRDGLDALSRFPALGARSSEYADVHVSIATALSALQRHEEALDFLARAESFSDLKHVQMRRVQFVIRARAFDARGDGYRARQAAREFWMSRRDESNAEDGAIGLRWMRELQHEWTRRTSADSAAQVARDPAA